MKKTMKIIGIVLILFAVIILMTGCPALRGELLEVTVVLKNSTDYELEQVIFTIPPTAGSYSPMYDLVTSDTENLKPNEEREFVIKMYENDFGNQGTVIIYIKDDENEYGAGIISVNGEKNKFNITCDDEMNFILTITE